ncbi:hypothetical protein CTI12_AA465590 [Artemisia annua]|uniref:DUF6598 domain-containing protein n=1 Tax=Artemisia annua TaxID=35608 RepID=A0A2U1LPY3_ARTAN|nr:hypothetical protein CTI12_AA465590 [Artemisia annua]
MKMESEAADKEEIFQILKYLMKKAARVTHEEKIPSFWQGPRFRFELCRVVPRYDIDPLVTNFSGYDELLLFGIIQAETRFLDPSHYGSFSIFNRNFDDPLVFTNPGPLSPQDICYCSLPVSTSVKISAKLYGTTYKGYKMCGRVDYLKYFPVPPNAIKHPTSLAEWEKAKKTVYIDNDALEISKGNAFINFSEYFANRPNGGSGSCKLNGRNGNLELYYVALKYAVDATLKVLFVAPSEERKVAGKIMAYYGKNFDYGCSPAEKDLYSVMLYETKPGEFVKPGEINLMRSVLAVPAQFSLIINAKLHDFTSGDIVLSGVYEFFVPAEGGIKVGFIKENDCSLNLTVDWKLPVDMLSV